MRPGETRSVDCPGTCSSVSITRDKLYTDDKPEHTTRPTKAPPDGPYTASIGLKELHRFKSQWPCHGFPDSLARIVFSFEANGDLCDVEAFTRRRAIDSSAFDGPALVALCHDAQRKVHPQHAADRERS